ncbi:MAG: YggS family pyridoxal phosphate-dependent enzyme [Gemmatimonadales bacterium]|nr:MAG: YggS family pyridoxal phosphate-dependent enzyme [Gemmatimonadales bacterium]
MSRASPMAPSIPPGSTGPSVSWAGRVVPRGCGSPYLTLMQRDLLRQRRTRVLADVDEAAARAGRTGDDVTLVAVTKGHPFEVVEAALEIGLREFGENRVESLVARAGRVADAGCRWHMVGRLQRRQAPELHGVAELVHSVDSLRLAERLARTAPEGSDTPLRILVQVNTSGEEAKTGLAPEEASDTVARILELGELRVDGLMTMAPYTDDERVLRQTFAGLRELAGELRRQLPEYRGKELSMGMSNDYRVAVEEGSTMIRLGTVLFGEREA